MTKQEREREKEEAIRTLKKWVRPGDTIYTILEGRSASGMTRWVNLYVFRVLKGGKRNAEPIRLTWAVGRLCGYKYSRKHEALEVGGCGFDAGFDVVHALSYYLHGKKDKGDGTKEENQGRSMDTRPGHYQAGYSLNHRWMG